MSLLPAPALLLAPHAGEPTSGLLLAAAERLGFPLSLVATAGGPALPGQWHGPILPRVGLRFRREAVEALLRLTVSGADPVNEPKAIARAKWKPWLLVAGRLGLPRPTTVFVRPSSRHAPPPLPLPFVVKPLRGARGEGIRLVGSAAEWNALEIAEDGALVEEFLPVETRREWRILVFRDRVLAATERRPAPGDFRANRARGAEEIPTTPPPGVVEIARQATRLYALGFAGIDLAAVADGPPLVLDVNDSPGLVGISRATGRDLAEELLLRWRDPGPGRWADGVPGEDNPPRR